MACWSVHLNGAPRRVNHAAVAIATDIFTFGGFCDSGNDDFSNNGPIDVYKFNTVKLEWSKLTVNQDRMHIPPQRSGHTVVAVGSKVYMWGGILVEEQCNILYCFDIDTLEWSTPTVYGIVPMPTDGHSACVINNKMYVFSGFREGLVKLSHDLYMLDLDTMTWSIIETNGNPPSPRYFHTVTAIGDKMYVFGGHSIIETETTERETYCNKMYSFDTISRTWVCPITYGVEPFGRRSHSAFVHNGFIYIFGGFNKNLGLFYNDLHRYDPAKSTWMKINSKGIPPCARRRQICVLIKDQVFISGGTRPIDPEESPLRFKTLGYELMILMDMILVVRVPDATVELDDLHVLNLKPNLKHLIWATFKKLCSMCR